MHLNIATGDHERSRFLSPSPVEGLELEVHPFVDDAKRHLSFLAGSFDACEFSLSIYMGRLAKGEALTAIPVFPNRRFRHSFVYTRRDRHIVEPRDLHGKTVGLVSWFNTAAVWIRGLLTHDYGLDLTRVRWVGLRPPEVPGWTPPSGIRYDVVQKGSSLEDMLLRGEVDAIMLPEVIPAVRRHDPAICRLFEDYFTREQDYFKRTGILPISHAVVIRQQIVDEYPDLPMDLWKTWVESKRRALEYADDPGHSNLLWYGYLRDTEADVLGPDPWRYNIADNRRALETFVGYCVELGLLKEPFADVETLFHPSVRAVR